MATLAVARRATALSFLFFDGHPFAGQQHVQFGQALAQCSPRLLVAMYEGYPLWLESSCIGSQFSTIGMRAQVVLGNVTADLHLLPSDIQSVLLLFSQV